MEHGTQLAGACFAIGIVSLLWVFRRTLLRSRPGGKDSQDRGSYVARLLAARQQIGQISARESLLTYRRALQIPRREALGPLQLAELKRISAVQLARRQD